MQVIKASVEHVRFVLKNNCFCEMSSLRHMALVAANGLIMGAKYKCIRNS